MHFERTRGEFTVSSDPARFDVGAIHAFLSRSYWAEGIPRALVERSLAHSLGFGLYHAGEQIGFARVVSDFATMAYLADVYVLEAYRGRGLASWLMECVKQHPQLQGLRRWSLVTRDAHALYLKHGFAPLANPDRYMEIVRKDAYREER